MRICEAPGKKIIYLLLARTDDLMHESVIPARL